MGQGWLLRGTSSSRKSWIRLFEDGDHTYLQLAVATLKIEKKTKGVEQR